LTPGSQIDPATGLPITTPDPVTGLPVPVPASYLYYVLPVENTTGGVLTRVEATGDINLGVHGVDDVVDVVHLNHMGSGELHMGGVGTVNAYFVEGAGTTSAINGTDGDIVSGLFDTVDTIAAGGNIGRAVGALGQWIRGRQPTSVAAAPGTHMGWLNRTIDGIYVTGDVNVVRAGGWLGDVLVEGRLDLAVANNDNFTAPDSWDGVIGVVEADAIGTIHVGDGLADDGSGDRAMAAILGRTSIGSVLIDGPGHVLNGAILTGGIGSVPAGTPAIGRVIGTNGAVCTALVMARELDMYQLRVGARTPTGGIGTIRFSGPGAAITGAEIAARWINTIEATVETEGINHCFVTANLNLPNRPAITEILAGGPGLLVSKLSTNGGRFGVIRGIGPDADITLNRFLSTDGLDELKARDIVENEIYIPLQIDRFIATREIVGNTDVTVGSIGTLSTGTDFAGNEFEIAANFSRAVIGGHFDNSALLLEGPGITQLGVLDVQGNISGTIRANGRIGQIISRRGEISADIITLDDAFQADVGGITAQNGFSGELHVAGSVGRFTSYATLGTDPTQLPDMVPLRMNIAADLDMLQIKTTKGGPAVDLFSSLYVGGDVGTIDIDGSLYANVQVNGDLGSLVLDGDMGGEFMFLAPMILGDVTVLGQIGKLVLPDGANVVGDLTSGGSIGKIQLRDKAGNPAKGNVLGVIRSIHGSIGSVTLTNGVLGGLEAA
ncbi:MAG: hypothetical protein ACYS5V_14970, partial [Planctomycetota bacterium]